MEESEELGLSLQGRMEQDADAEVHEGRGEVHRALALRCYRQVRDREINILRIHIK